jgi:serine/threonine-protein kinase SRK2
MQKIMALEYSIPAHIKITSACQDLFDQIFVIDPAQRITIAGIQRHPWFLKNLAAKYKVGI